MNKTIISVLITIIGTFLLAGPVSALEIPTLRGLNRIASPTARLKLKLEESRLRVCLVKEKVIKQRLTSLNQVAEVLLSKYDSVLERIKAYYTEKVVPTGKTLSNYDTLLADIGTKKTAVQAALTAAKTNVSDFSCQGDDPKGQLTQFRQDMQAVKKSIQEYHTAIKNLLVAIRNLAKPTNTN